MITHKCAKWLFILAGVSVLILGGFLYVFQLGVFVSIKNANPNALRQIKIIYAGGVVTKPRINPGKRFATFVKPDGKSDLSVEWVDSDNKTNIAVANAYFGPLDHGRISATIGPSNLVNWVGLDQLKTY